MVRDDRTASHRRTEQSQDNLARLIGGRPSHSTREYHDVSHGRTRNGTGYVARRLQQQRRGYVNSDKANRIKKHKDATWALAVGAVVCIVIIEIVLGLVK